MGRPNQKVYEYTTDGVFIKKYESISDFRRENYPDDIGCRPIFEHKIEGLDFHVSTKETIILKERIYRDKVKFLYRIYISEFCNFRNTKETNKPIQMFNLKNELLAEFANLKVAQLIVDPKYKHTLITQLKQRKGVKTFGLSNDYYFQYKDSAIKQIGL